MSILFDLENFLTLGFSFRSYKDSWNKQDKECVYTRDDTTLTFRKQEDTEFVMGICSTNSGEWENYIVDQEEALHWFTDCFPFEAPRRTLSCDNGAHSQNHHPKKTASSITQLH